MLSFCTLDKVFWVLSQKFLTRYSIVLTHLNSWKNADWDYLVFRTLIMFWAVVLISQNIIYSIPLKMEYICHTEIHESINTYLITLNSKGRNDNNDIFFFAHFHILGIKILLPELPKTTMLQLLPLPAMKNLLIFQIFMVF